ADVVVVVVVGVAVSSAKAGGTATTATTPAAASTANRTPRGALLVRAMRAPALRQSFSNPAPQPYVDVGRDIVKLPLIIPGPRRHEFGTCGIRRFPQAARRKTRFEKPIPGLPSEALLPRALC